LRVSLRAVCHRLAPKCPYQVKGVGADLGRSAGRSLRAAAVAAAVADVGLTEKRHCRAAALSGGQKRKLCLAMALIGDPKVRPKLQLDDLASVL
jgi:ABC-type Mn2+/Zn2+ transport system ATPase subunit